MEAVPAPYAPEQSSISPYRQIIYPKRNNRRSISKPSENLSPSKSVREGLLLTPSPSLFSPFHSSPLLLDHHHLQPQPPLLPLPATKTYTSLPPISPPINKKNRSLTATPKKSKASTSRSSPKKKDSRSTAMPDDGPLMAASTNRIGPDPKDLPKAAVCRILTSGNTVTAGLDMFSGSVFTLSPPPSSLPLPKFSLRPKLGCNAEASGIDAGATDSLRRLLRLR